MQNKWKAMKPITLEQTLENKGFLKVLLWCWSVSVCVWEGDSERECSSLLELIYSINHSIWSLFIFTGRMVVSASHWALYVLPRRFPSNSERAEHTFSCNLESKKQFQYFSDISRFLNFMAESPQTCLSLVCKTCRYTSFTHALIYVDAASSL